MARTEAKLSYCQIVQELNRTFWNWAESELWRIDSAVAGDIMPLMDFVCARLTVIGLEVQEMYGIVHNQDSREEWADAYCQYVRVMKPAHVHIVVKFKKGKGGTITNIAATLGLAPQFIEKAKKGRFAYDNMLAYLIHAKDEDKFQYKPSEVVEMPGIRKYENIAKEHWDDWMSGKAAKKKKKAEESIDSLEEKILTGEVTKQQVILTDELFAIYSRFKRRCDDAFAVYGERKAYKTIEALERGEFKLSVFFITGSAGAGKTRFAKRLVSMLIDASAKAGDRWHVCQTAATNPMDDYNGEELLLMDDVRGGSMTASDWLKLLDPYNISPLGARYYNRVPACKCVIITSSKEPLEFFYYCRALGGDRSEALDQFLRRIQSLVRVIHTDDYSEPEFRISDSVRREHIAAVPGTYDGRGNLVSVGLKYGFAGEQVMDEEEALTYLGRKVSENGGLPMPEEPEEEPFDDWWREHESTILKQLQMM